MWPYTTMLIPSPYATLANECSVLLFPLKASLPPHRLRAASAC